ncbi:MAG: potassium channel family protein [Candidatus Limnocylindrales bacterium]
MKIVIVGCGRVGSTLAQNLDEEGHDVIVLDIKTAAFDRLPETFKGSAVRGDGTDEEVLRRAGAKGADIFLSLTEGDNRNIMAAQVATENLGIPRVIAKINDPVRAAAYAELGVVTVCRTNLMVHAVASYLDLTVQTGPGIDTPQTPGHKHPHPSTALSAVHAPALPAEATPIVQPRSTGAAANETDTSTPADVPPPRRIGFRRWQS